MTVVVAGGAGYIGSHMVRMLKAAGYAPLVVDDFSHGHRAFVHGVPLVEGDIGDAAVWDEVFTRHAVQGVMHFAGWIEVGASKRDPGAYYDNNVAKTLVLLRAMVRHNVGPLIFSSTAAIFGEPEYVPIDEAHPQRPINPYGRSKLMVEHMLADFREAHGLNYGCLRYFNAAGADPAGGIGEAHEPETHLIPLALRATAAGAVPLKLFGDDYPTPDGTCLRDYVHVNDLCDAHLKLLEYLKNGGNQRAFNLGNGLGYSVREVVECVQQVTGKAVAHEIAPRRPGDPARLVADGTLARKELGWQPQFTALEEIVRTAWAWEQAKPR